MRSQPDTLTNPQCLHPVRFERDDIVQKLSVLFYLVNLFGYTTNIAYAFEHNSTADEFETYIPMMSFYLLERFYGALYFAWLSYVVRESILLLQNIQLLQTPERHGPSMC